MKSFPSIAVGAFGSAIIDFDIKERSGTTSGFIEFTAP